MGPVAAGLALAPMAVAFFVASLAGPRLVRAVRQPGGDRGRADPGRGRRWCSR